MPDMLKPCAHCGGKATLYKTISHPIASHIECTNPSCGVRTKRFDISTAHSSDEKAIAAWNRRVEDAQGGEFHE